MNETDRKAIIKAFAHSRWRTARRPEIVRPDDGCRGPSSGGRGVLHWTPRDRVGPCSDPPLSDFFIFYHDCLPPGGFPQIEARTR